MNKIFQKNKISEIKMFIVPFINEIYYSDMSLQLFSTWPFLFSRTANITPINATITITAATTTIATIPVVVNLFFLEADLGFESGSSS